MQENVLAYAHILHELSEGAVVGFDVGKDIRILEVIACGKQAERRILTGGRVDLWFRPYETIDLECFDFVISLPSFHSIYNADWLKYRENQFHPYQALHNFIEICGLSNAILNSRSCRTHTPIFISAFI
jgi:hypothetical protein